MSDVCQSRRGSCTFQTAEAYAGVAILDLIHQGLYLSHMGHSGGRVKQFAWVWLLGMNLAQIPRCIDQQSCEIRVGPGRQELKL